MDINHEYAAHQAALMRADSAGSPDQRRDQLAKAALIAGRIGAFQHELGASAAFAWNAAHLSSAAAR
jgi:hypothetical protein